MHGEPCSARPPNAFAMRSGPTESGSVTWSAIGESFAVTSNGSRPVTARSAARQGAVSAGTTEHSTLCAPEPSESNIDMRSSLTSSEVVRPLVSRHDSSSSAPRKRPTVVSVLPTSTVMSATAGRPVATGPRPASRSRSLRGTACRHDQPSSLSFCSRFLATKNDSPTLTK
jgi:hypothetical protein